MQVNNTLWSLDKNLSIAPSLDIIFRLKNSSYSIGFLNILFTALQELEVIPFYDDQCITVISHDRSQGGWEGRITPELWQKIIEEIKYASSLKIRKKQIVLKICKKGPLTDNYVDDLSLSVNQNIFPDQGIVISLQFSTSEENPWAYLQYIRDNLISKLELNFFWGTLGYKFILNPFNRTAHEVMRASCMRYPGVDLHDVVCVHNSFWWDKLRTINWQVTLNVTQVLCEKIETSPQIMYYKTGNSPSICDRNSSESNNLSAIHEYKVLEKKLSSRILNSDNISWLCQWNNDIYVRWSNRWNEIDL